jgi:hypothetical protein
MIWNVILFFVIVIISCFTWVASVVGTRHAQNNKRCFELYFLFVVVLVLIDFIFHSSFLYSFIWQFWIFFISRCGLKTEDTNFLHRDDENARALQQQQQQAHVMVLKKVPLSLGECQGNCGKNTVNRCARGLRCARENQKDLIKSGHHTHFAYCAYDTIQPRRRKKNYFCYDPIKLQNPPCPVGDDPTPLCTNKTFYPDMSCMMTPLSLDYCCQAAINEYNATHMTCQSYQTCPGYGTMACENIGTPKKPEYAFTAMSSTLCHGGHQCV